VNGEAKRWAIVGGGMLGATLALRLAQQGQRVRLLEAADHLGGVADAWKLGDLTCDRHYHVVLLSDLYLRRLLAELGLEDEIEWVETKTGFYTDGKLYSMSNMLEFLRFPPLKMLDKFRLGLTILRASKLKDGRPLEGTPVARWLRRWSGKRTFEKLWLPLLRAKLGENHEMTSAAFIQATIARMYAARRTGLKKEMFGCVPGGYERILDRFAGRLAEEDVDVQLGRSVRRVTPADGGRVDLELADGRQDHFDRVVLTIPSPSIVGACPGLSEDEKQRHGGLRYQGIVCASLLLDKPLAEYYVTNITDPSPFTAVIEMTALVDPRHFGRRRLVYLPKYVSPDDPIFELPDEEIRTRFLGALERMYPHFRRSGVSAFRISRVRNLMALPTLDYSAQLPPIETSIEGVFAVNGAQIVNGTFNVNETVRMAEHTVRRILMPDILSARTGTIEAASNVAADRQLVARP